jgi:hypothetical protein
MYWWEWKIQQKGAFQKFQVFDILEEVQGLSSKMAICDLLCLKGPTGRPTN